MSGKVIKLPNSTHYIRNVIPADAVAKTEMKLEVSESFSR